MGTYEELKAAIQQVIRTNGNNEITGALLQQTLLSIVNSVGANAAFAGIATPNTNPGTADQNVFYLATEAGTYVNFGGIEINMGEAVILSNKTGNWVKNTSGFATQQQLTELESEIGYEVIIPTGLTFDGFNISWESLVIYLQGNKYEFGSQSFDVESGTLLVFDNQTKEITIKYAWSWLNRNDVVLLYNNSEGKFTQGLLYPYYVAIMQSNKDNAFADKVKTIEESLVPTIANSHSNNIMGMEVGMPYPVVIRKGDKVTISSADNSSMTFILYGINSAMQVTGYYAKTNVESATITADDNFIYLMWAKLESLSNVMINFGSKALDYTSYLPVVDFFNTGITALRGRISHIFGNQVHLDKSDLSSIGAFRWGKELRGWSNGKPAYNDAPNKNIVTIEFPLNELTTIEFPFSAKTHIGGVALTIYSADKLGANFKVSDIENNTNQYVVYTSVDNIVRVDLQPFIDSFQSTHVAISFAIDNYFISNPLAPSTFSVTRKMLDSDINAVTDLKIILSPQICLMDGDTQTLYVDNFSADTNDVSKKCSRVDFSHGGFSEYKKFKGGIQVTGKSSDPANPHPLDFYFYDNNEVKQGAITNVRVVSSDSGNGSSIQVLCIGDSLTDDGRYIAKTAQRFANDGMSVEFVGTKGDGSLSNPHREGNSGWNTKAYVTQQTFNGRTNPFYNPSTGTFDFAYYCKNNGYNPDIVLLALGTNEITVSVGGSVPTVDNFTQYWDTMLSSIKAFNPNIKVAIWLCPIPCQLAELELNEKIKRMQVVDKLLSKYNYKGYFFLPIYPIIGAYDYNLSDLEVHDSEKYKICTDILHFGDAGHQKISNALFASLKYWATKL